MMAPLHLACALKLKLLVISLAHVLSHPSLVTQSMSLLNLYNKS